MKPAPRYGCSVIRECRTTVAIQRRVGGRARPRATPQFASAYKTSHNYPATHSIAAACPPRHLCSPCNAFLTRATRPTTRTVQKAKRMAVKDLVGLYESRTDTRTLSPPDQPRAKSGQTRQASLIVDSVSSALSVEAPDVPAPSPARFIAHPLLRRREPSTTEQDDDPAVPETPLSHGSMATYAPISTVSDSVETVKETVEGDLADELLSVLGRKRSAFLSGNSRSRTSSWVEPAGAATDEETAIELQSLLPGSSYTSTTLYPRSKYQRDTLYRAETASLASTSSAHKDPLLSSSTVTLVQSSRVLGPHNPIPLSRVLARNAAPVSLSKLDEYISSLEVPRFPVTYATGEGKGKERDKSSDMFPPLERLDGTSIVDLENNSKIPPAWRNRDTIFSSLLNVALGITVCLFCVGTPFLACRSDKLCQGSSAIASFYSLQGLVDTLQIFALLLSTFCKWICGQIFRSYSERCTIQFLTQRNQRTRYERSSCRKCRSHIRGSSIGTYKLPQAERPCIQFRFYARSVLGPPCCLHGHRWRPSLFLHEDDGCLLLGGHSRRAPVHQLSQAPVVGTPVQFRLDSDIPTLEHDGRPHPRVVR